jgi:hypothetical protein
MNSLEVSQEIISKVDQGVSPKAIAHTYVWNDLPLIARTELLEEAERRSEHAENPMPLLRTLYRLTSRQDPWTTLRVLMCVFYTKDVEGKKAILDSMRKKLGEIRESLSGSQPEVEEVNRYLQYRAEYYVLEGQREIEAGNLNAAIQSYENALSRYKGIDPPVLDRISLIEKDLNHLREINSRNQHLVPEDKLESKQIQLQREISQDLEELKAIQHETAQEVASRDSLRDQCDKLKQEMERYEDQKAKLTQLRADLVQHEAALQFLTVLPRAAMAPLWVEVVRLALSQGEIDMLTRSAIERMIVPYSEEALPLLAEIVARTPDSVNIDQETYKACTRHWMGKIAEARRLKEEKGIRAAAETLVEAWETYFDALGGDA